MTTPLTPDLCVLGAGAGGLSVAAVAAQLGASVVLIEKNKMGGDCLNYGCVPSKALLAASHAAHHCKQASAFGVNVDTPTLDYQVTHDWVANVIAGIAPHDSVERFTELGVHVIQAAGHFVSPEEVHAGDLRIRARFFVIATGSEPTIPSIPGLAETPFETNETVFSNTSCPTSLAIIGGGPIGCELAQAFTRLGASVSLLQRSRLLPNDDPELAAVVRDNLTQEGVCIIEDCQLQQVQQSGDTIALDYLQSGHCQQLQATQVLVAAGRQPVVASLQLEKAQVDYSPKGIRVNARQQTSNKRIYALGDVTGPFAFTHMASYQAGIIIRNCLFRLPAKARYQAVPWVTYTSPELAHVGLSYQQLQAYNKTKVLRFNFSDNDRARCEGLTAGLIKVTTTTRGKILACDIVGSHAGELIAPWGLAIQNGLKISAMANLIAPYPTLSEVSKRAAGNFYLDSLFSPKVKRLIHLLKKIPLWY